MCIIVVKPQGKEAVPLATLATCWHNNPDGAGFVIHRPGQGSLMIRKGFMTLEALVKALDAATIQAQDTVICHFRIATSGGITPANCHRFPVSARVKDLKALSIECRTAFVHNGILGHGSGGLSDTQMYVLKSLSRYGDLQKNRGRIARDTAGSRTAILHADGLLWLTGTWVEEDGYHFSNRTFIDQGWDRYAFEWDIPDICPDVCEYCHSAMPLPGRDTIPRCEQCPW